MSEGVLAQSDIDFVCNLAIEAGAVALSMQKGVHVSEKAPGDYVTDADKAVSKLIVGALSARMKGDLIVSEEGDRQQAQSARTWLVDPIDGTDHYMKNSRQYSVMIGMLHEGKLCYGWVYEPTEELLFFGGRDRGAFRKTGNEAAEPIAPLQHLNKREVKRIIIGRRDARNHPWLEPMPGVRLFQVGSVGVKVIFVLENRADMVAQLHGLMNVWDTAAPAAIALGAGLEVGSGAELNDELPYPQIFDETTYRQTFPIVIGRPGTLEWARNNLMRQPV